MWILDAICLGFLAVGTISGWIWFIGRARHALRCRRACASGQMAELDARKSLEEFATLFQYSDFGP